MGPGDLRQVPQQLCGAFPANTVESKPRLGHILENMGAAVSELPLCHNSTSLVQGLRHEGAKGIGCLWLGKGLFFTSLILLFGLGFCPKCKSAGKGQTKGIYVPL